MPNGADKNFRRLCFTINGFHARYKAWPTVVRVPAYVIPELRDHILGPEALAKVEAKVRLIPHNDGLSDAEQHRLIAEDGDGRRFDYDADHDAIPTIPEIAAEEWLDVTSLPGMNLG